MTVYDKNLYHLQTNERYIYMYKFIDKLFDLDIDSQIEYIQSVDAKECGKILSIKKSGKNYRLGSAFNPIQEAKKWAEQFTFNDIGIVISMFGFGNGTIPRELIKRMKSNEKVIFYEPSKEIFLYILNNYDITDLLDDERVYFVIEGLNDEDFIRILTHNIDENNVNSQVICSHPKYNELFPHSRKIFSQEIKKSNGNARVNQNTKSYFAKQSVYNTINNIRYIKKLNTLYELTKQFELYRDIPAIIVSAGPSLDKNIEELKNIKDKAVIISVDSAISSLLARDIIPDFTITIDPNNPPEAYNDERVLCIPMIIRSESNYKITKKHIGYKFFADVHEFYKPLYKELKGNMSHLTSGGSVSTFAFSMCLYMGFNNIILIGQDLSYVGDVTHTGGVKISDYNDNDNLYVESVYGDLVKTKNDWYGYLQWFINAVDVAKFKGCKVIDATEGGALIKGTVITTLREAIELHCKKEVNITEILNKLSIENENNHKKVIKNYISQSILDLNILKQKSNESIEICNKLIDLYNQDDDTDIIRDLDKKLTDNNGTICKLAVNQLLDEYITTEVRRAMSTIYKIEGDKKKEKVRTYGIALKIYEANIKGVDDIKEIFYEVINDIGNFTI